MAKKNTGLKSGLLTNKAKGGYSSPAAQIAAEKKIQQKQKQRDAAYAQQARTEERLTQAFGQEEFRLMQERDKRLEETNNMLQANYDAYASQLASNAAAQKAYYQQLYDENAKAVNANYDRNANNAYINYRQGQKALPEQLSQYGVTGGASESANLKLQAAYGSNLSDNEFSRNSVLSDARQNMIAGMNDIDSATNSALADAYAQNLAERAAYAQQMDDYYTTKRNDNLLDYQNRLKMNAQNYQNNIGQSTNGWYDQNTGRYHWQNTTLADRQKERDAQQMAQQAAQAQGAAWNSVLQQQQAYADAGYSTGVKVVDGMPYLTIGSKKKIGNTSGGSSGGGSRRSGGSSGGSSRGYSGGYSGGSSGGLAPVKSNTSNGKANTSKGKNNTYKTLQTNIANYQLKGNTSEKQLDRYTDQIQAAYKKGNITEKQAKNLLKMLN